MAPHAWRRCASVGPSGTPGPRVLGPGRDHPHMHALPCQPNSQVPLGVVPQYGPALMGIEAQGCCGAMPPWPAPVALSLSSATFPRS